MNSGDVILVTENDEPVGTMEKMEAHEKGKLHRAFSIFIFDKKGRMLLQQRAETKYHGALLWTNSCCSHPYPDEPVEDAATRRLQEELGFTTTLQKIFAFTYKAEVENNLVEYEYDHVFVGEYEGEIKMNRNEVNDWAYYSMEEITTMLSGNPQQFTSWFKIAFPQVQTWLKSNIRQ